MGPFGQFLAVWRPSLGRLCKPLFLNSIFLFKYCSKIKIALRDAYLAGTEGRYSQSYPQFLGISKKGFPGNLLGQLCEKFSSFGRQAPDAP